MTIKHILIILFIKISASLCAQSFRLSGVVQDAASGEAIVGAALYADVSAATNEYGFFSLRVPPGQLRVRCRYVGYGDTTFVLYIQKDTAVIWNLKGLVLSEIVVSGQENSALETHIGKITIPVETLKSRPALLGEPDLLKSLALMPGVSTGIEGSAGLYVRGGTPDQNLILLDGATIYNGTHLFGFLSVFNPDAVKHITLHKGGFPAKYGGRLASVLEVTMKEGDNQQRKSSFSIGAVSSHFNAEGPLRKGHSSWLLSGRASYLGLLGLLAKIKPAGEYNNYWMYDWNGKINVPIGRRGRLYASFYTGYDAWQSLSGERGTRSQGALAWGNTTATLRYTRGRDARFFNSTLTWNRYAYRINQQYYHDSVPEERDYFINRSLTADLAWRNNWQWRLSKRHQLESGIEIGLQSLQPNIVYFKGGSILADTLGLNRAPHYQALTSAYYIEDQATLNDHINVSVGLRHSRYRVEGATYAFTEPRVRLNIVPRRRFAFQIAYARMSQFVHLLTNSAGLPNDIWAPSTRRTPPGVSDQWSAGCRYETPWPHVSVTTEVFWRTMGRQIDYRQGTSFFYAGLQWEQLIVGQGEGRAKGFEVSVAKTKGRLNGWVAYTLSKNERRFPGINEGQWYPFRYDRRHDLSITGSYMLKPKLSLAFSWVYATGSAITVPVYFIGSPQTPVQPVYLKRNNGRLPDMHRLDLSLTKQSLSKRKREQAWTFGLYNAYFRKNPLYVEVLDQGLYKGDEKEGFYSAFRLKGLFSGLIPSFSYSIKLNR